VAAEELGRRMSESGIRLVYGGGSVGLMGLIARSVIRGGGQVTGIIPKFLKDREIMLGEVDELIVTADMHERKRAMFERADAFVALPGGIGTLEEMVEMMTWAQLGQHRKPVLVANLKGFWDPFCELIRHMSEQGFIDKSFIAGGGRVRYLIADTIGEIIPMLRAAVAGLPEAELAQTGSTELM
jgi:uncharacterized protein (TIGR00730 family)